MNVVLPFPFDRPWKIAQAVELACLLEASAAKVGNVHPAATFSDMNFAHFLASASAIAPIFGPPVWHDEVSHDSPSRDCISSLDSPSRDIGHLSVGPLILDSVVATRNAVGCNTNLGMLLLFAPLAKAHLLRRTPTSPLQQTIPQVLQQLTPSDSQLVYSAIRHAAPGGLGKQAQADVTEDAPADLVAAMAQVAHTDAVARQYTNGFADIFERLVPWLETELVRTAQPLEAICRVQLRWLAYQPDGLITRKAGPKMAAQVQQRAAAIAEECLANLDVLAQQPQMIEFDQFLRGDGHRRNPGTTADLIGAALLVHLLQ